MKKLAVLGSTGSIGQQTLDIVRSFPQYFKIIALAAGQNTGILNRQINEFKPEYFSCKERSKISDCKFISVEEMAALSKADIIVMAIGGTAGLAPTIAAVKAGKRIALANKESLVMAGEIVTAEVRRYNAELLPVDSEHSAIWQCLRGEKQINRLILTASGGPFINYSKSELELVTAEQALKHPSWKMGKKITIDSATLMNKGLEIIEARWLFDVPVSNIDIVIHPQSIIHSMVEFIDGSTKAQLSNPDMRLPIIHALAYPDRLEYGEVPRLRWDSLRSLTFSRPDMERFPCLRLAIEAGKKGGTYPAVLCSADETAVNHFLKGEIGFTDIACLVEKALDKHNNSVNPALDDILAAEVWAKETVEGLINKV